MKSCLLNTVCMLLPYLCLQCCSPVGPNGKDSAQQVQRGIHKTDDSSCKVRFVVLKPVVILDLNQ